MIKKTTKKKRIRKVNIRLIEKISYTYDYTCPYCKMNFVDYSFDENVTQFKCSNCKKEIRVGKFTKI